MSKQPTKPTTSSKNKNPSPRKGKNLKGSKSTDGDEDLSDDEDDELNISASEVKAVRLQLLPMSEQIIKQNYPPIKVIDVGILKTSEIILKSIKSVYGLCSKSTNNAMDNKKFILKDFVYMINNIEEDYICGYCIQKWACKCCKNSFRKQCKCQFI